MTSHNPKFDTDAKLAPVPDASDRNRVRAVRPTAQEADTFEISDDQATGGDPYNSTGQHVIMKIKQEFPE